MSVSHFSASLEHCRDVVDPQDKDINEDEDEDEDEDSGSDLVILWLSDLVIQSTIPDELRNSNPDIIEG